VDDHFYVDHPEFIEQPWRLRAAVRTRVRWRAVPAAAATSRSRDCSIGRSHCPSTTTPGRVATAVGGSSRSMGALQGWGVIWAVHVQPQPGELVPAWCAGLLRHGERSAEPGSLACEHLSVRARRHAAGTAQSGDRDDAAGPGRAPATHPAPGRPLALGRVGSTRIGTRVVDDPTASLPHDVVLPLGWGTPEGATPARKSLE